MLVGEPPLEGAVENVPGFDDLGIVAFTTTREQGSFAIQSRESAAVVFGRWGALLDRLGPSTARLAFAHQVHGDQVISHHREWNGWLRALEADGHFSATAGTGMAVTIADCVPIFIAHPNGAAAIVHSGWKGTELSIVRRALSIFRERDLALKDLRVHCGPAICGTCYEVSPDVYVRLTGRRVEHPTPVDLRAIIASQAADAGVREISISPRCTRCDNDRFFSHRCGDEGRQVGVICGIHSDRVAQKTDGALT